MNLKLLPNAHLFSLLFFGVILWSGAGCKRNENTAMQDKQAAPSNPQIQNTLERDPAKRPLVLSQPAPNRREWALQALKQGYHDTGKTNADWDAKAQTAFEVFADYSRISTTNGSALAKALTAVLATACNDPMIQYMRVRYDTTIQLEAQAASEFMRVHQAMMQSQYHPVFKFYAGLRAVKSARAADEEARSFPIEQTTASLEDLARDTNAPVDEVFEAARLWLDLSHSPKWTQYMTANLEPILKIGWGESEQWLRFEGNVELNRAWGERMDSWNGSAADKAPEGFAEHLAKADQFLTKAWQLNTNNAQTAFLMMEVELGQGKDLSRMELWFNRAMSVNPNFYDAAKLMSLYLQPQWHGSEEKSLTFGRSLVASDKWGGHVPLVLAELHKDLVSRSPMSNSPAYFRQPQVWNDVKSSYEKFLALNPGDAPEWRQSYAIDAYGCGQYQVFLEQAKLFTAGTNLAFFGGPEKFQQMLQTASTAGK